jgi:hypothetical protein
MKLFYRNLYAVAVTAWVCATDSESKLDRRRFTGCGYLGREIITLPNRGRSVIVDFEPVGLPELTPAWVTELKEEQLRRLLARRNDRA